MTSQWRMTSMRFNYHSDDRPDAHLRKLIAQASPEQNARAMCKAREYYQMCKRLGIEPAELPRVLKEALEMEMAGIYRAIDAADVGKARG